ncbi:MAG: efflux RND transporter periplasmic adaptor subunit [Myxococcota bacterium]|jgi:HlyD family secretion protein|nr:efflux RND transporter periplasmic adaptor subunit [Myxococcota bacterium]
MNDAIANNRDPKQPSGRISGDLTTILAESERFARRRRIFGFAFIALALAAVGFGGWSWFGKAEGGPETGMKFETVKVTRGDLKSTISATGTAQALNTVEVGAEISGRISSIHVDFNEPVTQGTLLAQIDPEQLKAATAQASAQVLAARAGVAEAEAALVEAKQEKDRVTALATKGLASARELEAATAKASRAEAARQSAQAQAALAKASSDSAISKLGKTKIIAPINGTVLSRKVEVGQTINAGMQTPVLFVIAEDLRRMQLSARVDESDIGAVIMGQMATFTVDAYPGKSFASKITSVRNVPLTDQNVVSYEVLLSVDNDTLLLRPGMTATVEIITSVQQAALLVPNKALRFSPPKASPLRGPPIGIPMLSRPKEKAPGQVDKGPVERLGKLDTHQAILWLPGGPEPRPVKVDKVATDGVFTAIRSDEVKEGIEVIVDLAPSEGLRP